MNLFYFFLVLHLTFVCLWSVECRPYGRGSRQKDLRRTRSGRRLRMLNRIFKRLSPDDVLQLARVKKISKDNEQTHIIGFTDSGMEPTNNNIEIPEIDCRLGDDGEKLSACPSPDRYGDYICIENDALCDSKINCPNGEDEDKTLCLFHNVTKKYLEKIKKTVNRLKESVV